jgi:pilus assembly protein CpaB
MGRMRGCLWLTAGLVVAVLAGAVAFITLNSASGRDTGEGLLPSPEVPAVVAATAIEVRGQLTTDNLEVKQIPVDALPEGAVQDLEEAVGKITLVDLYPGEVILAQRLVDPNVITGDGRLALVVAEDEVLMTFPAGDAMSQYGILKPGDHIDLHFSLDFPTSPDLVPVAAEGETAAEGSAAASSEEKQVTFSLLQNLTIAAYFGGDDGPVAMLLTVSPQDALILKYALDAGGISRIVLRAPGVEGPFDTDPVDIDYMINLYRIP